MGLIGGSLGYHILKILSAHGKTRSAGSHACAGKGKLETLLGPPFWREIEGKTVVDFGCGAGADAVEIAERGARNVIGIDIQESLLGIGRRYAELAGVSERCVFSTCATASADVIVTIDSFEHFADPATTLQTMRRMLNPGGCVIASFGPTWYHPLGGHLFSVFPWAHLLFTEDALMRWRSDFKTDSATRFGEVAGGLNQMTIKQFELLIEQSPFTFERLELIPIRKLRRLMNRLTREVTTARIRCKLVARD